MLCKNVVHQVFAKYIWFLIACVLLSACQGQGQRANSAQVSAKRTIRLLAQPLEHQLVDSLRKYRYLTEFLQQGDSSRYVVYGKETARGALGVVAITDSVLLLYQSDKKGLQLTNRVPFPDYASRFKEADLNGDGKADFMVYGRPNMHGQAEPFVFLSKANGQLHYRPDLKQYELSYDPNKELVHAYYLASGNSSYSKELYRWQDDSLQQIAEADWNPSKGIVTLFRPKNDKLVRVKTYHNSAVYDTILFKAEW
jgi:hypothetical protein